MPAGPQHPSPGALCCLTSRPLCLGCLARRCLARRLTLQVGRVREVQVRRALAVKPGRQSEHAAATAADHSCALIPGSALHRPCITPAGWPPSDQMNTSMATCMPSQHTCRSASSNGTPRWHSVIQGKQTTRNTRVAHLAVRLQRPLVLCILLLPQPPVRLLHRVNRSPATFPDRSSSRTCPATGRASQPPCRCTAIPTPPSYQQQCMRLPPHPLLPPLLPHERDST